MTDRFYKLPVGIAGRKDLTASAKLIFAVLLDRVGDNGHCWPGYDRVARDAGLSRTAVIESVKRLVSIGIISIVKRDGLSNLYEIRTGTESVRVDNPNGGQSGNRTSASTENVPEPDQLNQTHITRPKEIPASGAAGLFPDDGMEKSGGKQAKEEIVIPEKLAAIPGFSEAWQEWLEYRKERRLTCTPRTLIRQLKLLAEHPDPVQCIEASIRNGWQGIFEAKGNSNDSRQAGGNRKFEAANQQPGKFDRKPRAVLRV